MWLIDGPDVATELRQGDLLVGIDFPVAGTVRITAGGVVGEVASNATAVVLDHCCTVEQKHVVLLARVASREPDEKMMQGLQNLDPAPGQNYSRYLHLLESHPSLPTKKRKRKVINLLDRVQLIGADYEAFTWLREARKARMTAPARAHLRLKLAVHFGRVEEEEDLPELAALGLDTFGRPQPAVHHGFP